jgi:hypothetical protein
MAKFKNIPVGIDIPAWHSVRRNAWDTAFEAYLPWTWSGTTVSYEIYNETPSGTLNGVNTLFTITNQAIAWTTRLFLNGIRQKLWDDYTQPSSTSVQFSIAPFTNDNLTIDYTGIGWAGNEVYHEIPVWTIDWVNTIFTLSNSCVLWSTRVYLNGMRQRINIEYTQTSQTTIAFITPPLTGDNIILDYTLFI